MRAPRRLALVTLATCAAIALVMWIATGIFLARLERSTLEAATAQRQNFARSLAEYEASSVRAIDLSLFFLREMWRRDRSAFPAAVAAHEELLSKEKVIQVAVLDRDGHIVYSRLPQPTGVSFADRAYFAFHRTQARDLLHISEPLLGRVTQRWAIQFSRVLRDAAGNFDGVIVVAVPPPALEGVYKELDLGPNGVVTLARIDGQILARSSDFERTVAAPQGAWRAEAAGDAIAGDFFDGGSLDQVQRRFSYRKLPEYGLAVLVGQDIDAVRGPYVQQRDYVLAVLLLATLFLAGIAMVVVGRLRDKARFAARHEELILELHDGCIQAIYAAGLQLSSARALAVKEPVRAARMMADVEADLNMVIQELRAFIGGSGPTASTAAEFKARLHRSIPASHRSIFAVDVDEAVAGSLPAAKSEHVLRIVQEAATNVARHAAAQSARVSIACRDAHIELRIEDDGRGGAAQSGREGGLGLAHIRARARKLGGRATVDSAPGSGTRIRVEFPA